MTYAISLLFFVWGICHLVLDTNWLYAGLCFLVYAVLKLVNEMEKTREEIERWEEDELDE